MKFEKVYVPKLKDVVVYRFIAVRSLQVFSNFCYVAFNPKLLLAHFVCLQLSAVVIW